MGVRELRRVPRHGLRVTLESYAIRKERDSKWVLCCVLGEVLWEAVSASEVGGK